MGDGAAPAAAWVAADCAGGSTGAEGARRGGAAAAGRDAGPASWLMSPGSHRPQTRTGPTGKKLASRNRLPRSGRRLLDRVATQTWLARIASGMVAAIRASAIASRVMASRAGEEA